MNGSEETRNVTPLSSARRALLEKFRHGGLQKVGQSPLIPFCDRTRPIPLSFGQQQLWLLAQLLPDVPVYTECVTLHLPGQLDLNVLQQSFDAIIQRHEAWRTSFPVIDGQAVQRIHPAYTLPLPFVDLCHLPEEERVAMAHEMASQDAELPFDLAAIPLLRVRLVRLSAFEHRLFLTMHHIIFDGVALYQILLPELHALYHALIQKQPSPLTPLPLQYADYAVWQRQMLSDAAMHEQLLYWKKQLAGAPPSLNLPLDRPRPLQPTHRGAMYPFALSKTLSDDVKAFSRQERVTLYTMMVAVFQLLLSRYSGQEDVLIGMVTAGRNQSVLQHLLGFFLNTLVLRTDMTGNPTFRQLLHRVREVILEALAHQDVPFAYLVKELQPERRFGQNPLIQVMLSLEPMLPQLASGWTLTQMDVETHSAKFDLALELDDRPEGLIGRFEYSTELFDLTTIARLTLHWQQLMAAVVLHPDLPIGGIPLLTSNERQQVLFDWNRTQQPILSDRCIHHLFEEQVCRTPDAVALIFQEQRITYHQLDQLANRLAHHLQQYGVGPEQLVGILLERSPAMIVALLATLKAGAAYLPLDSSYPPQRLALMLHDAQAMLLLTHYTLRERLTAIFSNPALPVIDIDPFMRWPSVEVYPTPVIPTLYPENLAYVIYTSGSTGTPKGVAVTHANLLHSTMARLSYYHEPVERFLLLSSFSFDSSVAGIFWTLCQGGALVIAAFEAQRDPSLLATLIEQQCISHMLCLPTLYQLLLELPVATRLQSLRVVIVAGERCRVELVDRHYQLLTAQLFNEYGPTEGTVWSSTHHCQRGENPVPIGRPIANMQIYLLDRFLQPVPIGVSAELFIGGAGLARGYLHQPELTAQRFLPHPFDRTAGARLYQTGDVARHRPDGVIEFLGRIDQQVKIRGFRVEPGEVEARIRQQVGVQDVIVVAREDALHNHFLVAYVVAVADVTLSIAAIKHALQKELPEYMLPSAFVQLDTFAVTPNGKIDQQALPMPSIERAENDSPFAAPISMLHYQLVAIWEDLLQVHPIGIQDNFFTLGGHSLLAARMIMLVEQMCAKKLSLRTLFAGPTIEQVALALVQTEEQQNQSPLVRVQLGGEKRPLFFLHGDITGGAFYCFALAHALDPDQPFYVIEPSLLDTTHLPLSIEETAARYISALRAVQPEGPYLLGGFCNGALMAYEMACQLVAQQQAIDLLVLIDPVTLPRLSGLHRLMRRIGKCLHISETQQFDAFLRLRYLYMLLLRKTSPEEMEFPAASRSGLAAIFPSRILLRGDFASVWSWLASQYTLKVFPGKCTMLWAEEEQFEGVWQQLAHRYRNITFERIPGSHITCRTSQLPALAERIRTLLKRLT